METINNANQNEKIIKAKFNFKILILFLTQQLKSQNKMIINRNRMMKYFYC
ncbi:unnamed protein product [Paramecium primaurelia]|uniref:Uncharacterized protein n=1 Tax=Paramecium primaurelia TaxID=5886 RepID=A0A8S1NKR3_PARPR|nr:unnamed protein product [Paramecium primaurelia]